LLVRYRRDDYIPDVVMIYGAYIDNAAIPETGEAEYIEKWNQEFAFPKFLVTTDAEYFDYIEEHFSDELPVYRGDAGAYWEDGVASSAEATSWSRQTQQLLPVAETSASFATMFEPRYRYPSEDFREVWKNLLFYDEHTWGAFNSTSQPDREGVRRQWEIKESYARRANLDARTMLARSLNRLCQQIVVDGNIVFAFNWQNRIRSQYLETELAEGSYLLDLDADEKVPVDVILSKEGWQRVRFLAKDVPAMGYRGYAVKTLDPPSDPENGKEPSPSRKESSVESWIIENEFYRLEIDEKTGGVMSLTDKSDQRELVDKHSEYALNQYLYVSGGDESLILNLDYGKETADLTIHTPTSARLIENIKTPLGQRITIETSSENTPLIRSEYLLYDVAKRIDIVNTVQKDSIRDKEGIYFAFPFAASQPQFEYQFQNGWLRPNKDQLPGACREWFSSQNLVHLQDGDYSVAWASPDAPLLTLEDINRGKWLTDLKISNGHLFSYVMNNYWWTNYRAEQGGEFRFRYSITSGSKLSREELADFDVDTRSPVLVYPYLASFSASVVQQDRPLSSASGSLMQLDADDIQIVVLKQAEDGDGWILRLLETAGRTGQATLELPLFRVHAAQLCNGVEVNEETLEHTDHTVTIPYLPNRYTTVRLSLSEAAP
jgi:alpha-mannosidase